jgi:hypothetical protein
MSRTLIRQKVHNFAARLIAGQPLFTYPNVSEYVQRIPGFGCWLPVGRVEAGERTAPQAIIWEVPDSGDLIPFKDLSDAEQVKLRKQVQDSVAVLQREGKRLTGDPTKSRRDLGMVLQRFETPADDFLYTINGKPVITGWGLSEEGPEPKIETTGFNAVAAPNESTEGDVIIVHDDLQPPPPPPCRKYLWALLGGLLALIVALLVFFFFCEQFEYILGDVCPRLKKCKEEVGSLRALLLNRDAIIVEEQKKREAAEKLLKNCEENLSTLKNSLEEVEAKLKACREQSAARSKTEAPPIIEGPRPILPGPVWTEPPRTVWVGTRDKIWDGTKWIVWDGTSERCWDGARWVLCRAQRIIPKQRVITLKVLEVSKIQLSVEPPDPEAKWHITINADAPEEVQQNPQQFVRFDGSDEKTAIGATARVKLSPLPSGRSFIANVVATDSNGQQTIHQLTVGGR